VGIVPGDETALGHEAAGVIRNVGSKVSELAIGDRVVVFGKGCFSNRIQTTPARVHRIPDNMTFEEAATLPIVGLTVIHSLLDLGNLSSGKSVLIHSAAGGVGIAAIQLAQHVGAEVYVTVGTPEKRQFLRTTFGLADDHIFNSRNTEFGDQILSATDGKGIDVVLNSLVGDMLDESFRVLAHGGIMVELGKRDVLDRNTLPMAPFDRNSSFRAVDLSPEKAPDALVSRLMSKLFELVDSGSIKPITPIHKFEWTNVPAALRFLRPGTHIGKAVLSQDSSTPKLEMPVSESPLAIYINGLADMDFSIRFEGLLRVLASAAMAVILSSAVFAVSLVPWQSTLHSREQSTSLLCHAVDMRMTSRNTLSSRSKRLVPILTY
jgi:NADPH:quinone reductase-like Zn-dependent oxidoreductase